MHHSSLSRLGILIFGLMLTGTILAASKTETELRARLAAAEAQQAVAIKERAVLSEALATIKKQQLASLAAAAKVLATSKNQVQAADTAKADAHAATATAEVNGSNAVDASTQALILAARAAKQSELDALAREREAGKNLFAIWTLVITTTGGLITLGIAQWSAHWKMKTEHDWNVAAATVQNGKLDAHTGALHQIHTLVNSAMTEALENELDARRAALAALRELLSMRQDSGAVPTGEALAAIDQLRAKIKELEVTLTDRKLATDVGAKQAAADIAHTQSSAT